MSNAGRFILLDRDGVLIAHNPEGIKKVEDVLVLPFVPEALSELKRREVRAFVLVHEPMVADKVITQEDLDANHARLNEILEQYDVQIENFTIATLPDGPATPTAKVRAGLIRKVANENGIDLADTFYVGDEENDLDAAREAGCRFCLVRTGRGNRTLRRVATSGKEPDLITKDLFQAVTKIFAD